MEGLGIKRELLVLKKEMLETVKYLHSRDPFQEDALTQDTIKNFIEGIGRINKNLSTRR